MKKKPTDKRTFSTLKSRRKPAVGGGMDFAALVSAIRQVHDQCAAQVSRAVNVTLTARNWVVGYHIHQYELHGRDRAKYGEGLFSALAERLQALKIPNCNKSRLYRYRDFFKTYPQIVATLLPQFHNLLPGGGIQAEPPIVATVTPLSGQMILDRLSYSHIELLLEVDDPLKRTFYEIECIRGNWSVRQLKRQIATLYFERSGLSRDKEKLAAMVKAGAETAEPRLAIRDPYIFEFLGLRAKDAVADATHKESLSVHPSRSSATRPS